MPTKQKQKDNPPLPQLNQSAEKTMRIIELLSDTGQPMRLLDIARTLDLNVSTTSRFLSTLVALGYVEQEPEYSRYYLTFKLCHMADKVQGNFTLSSCAVPQLHQLAKELGQTVCLAVEEGQQVVYIEVVSSSDRKPKAMQRIGSIAPLHCTGIGKLLLLNYSYTQLFQLYKEKGFTRFTPNTITDVEGLFSRLATIRQDGYAFDDEECEMGIRCIALPIYNYTGKIIAGFSVTGMTESITDAFIQKNLPLLTRTAYSISHRLGAKFQEDS